jgi:solute carrier family 25 uncoupling protein 8/9
LLHFAASLASGVVAQTVTQPADTIKTLVMARAGGEARSEKNVGAWATARALVTKSGPAALYRGFWPAAARQGPVMVIQMPIVEQFRKAMGLEYF